MLLLVHYFLPVAIGWSLALVMGRATGAAISPTGLTLLLAGIGAAYSFDRLIDAASASAPRSLWLYRTLSGGFAVCVGTILTLLIAGEIRTDLLCTCAILSSVSLLYSRLKRIPFAKTLTVAVAWTWACATLPFSGSSVFILVWPVTGALLSLLLLLSAACLLCDLKDVRQDRHDQICSLPVLIGLRQTCFVAATLAAVGVATAVLSHRPGLAIAGVLLAGSAWFPNLLARQVFGPMLVDSILVMPGLLIACRLV